MRQVLAGTTADERSALQLSQMTVHDFSLLTMSGVTTLPNQSDADLMKELRESYSACGISDAEA